MKRRAALALVAAGLIGAEVRASMPVPIPLVELYAMASTVAVVEIVEGRVVSAGGEWCGVRYVGRVIDPSKNAKTGASIEFGFVPELKVGAAYLVLLGGFDNAPMESEPNFRERCQAVLPPAVLVQYWRGAMEVVGDTRNASKRSAWSLRPVKYVSYPLGTRSVVVGDEKQLVYTDLVSRMKGEK